MALDMPFRHTHHWTENDPTAWDHIGANHWALDDRGSDEKG